MAVARLSRCVRFVVVLLPVFCLAAGCGGAKAHRVSGKVTFKGQPVPLGKIYFIPDGAKGNTGQTGFADIKDGAYDTSATGGLGAISGPVTVAIEGFEPNAQPDASGEMTTNPLFSRYETAIDLPTGNTTKDFDVPATAAVPPKKRDPTIE